MTDSISVQVCVVGAGPVGGALACRLANAGVSVALIDQSALPPMENPAFDGRAYAIAAGSRQLLEHAGLWDLLDVPPNPIRDIRVSDGRVGQAASRLYLHFNHLKANVDSRPFGWIVEARSLRKALNTRFSTQPNLRLFAPAQAVVTRTAAAAIVKIPDRITIRCGLVVAAEGRNSPLREQAGIPVTRIPYHQTAIVCAVAHERPHNDTALEQFLPAGPFAVLPMASSADAEAGGASHVSAIVWTVSPSDAVILMDLSSDRFAREIGRRLGSHLGAVRPVGRRWSYPLSAMIAHRYVQTRLALVGDAAHGIHPIAGQGLNLGFQDGIELSDSIINAANAQVDVGSNGLLARYHKARRFDNLVMFTITDGMDRLFSTDRHAARIVRDLGIRTVHRLDPVKRIFMLSAMGVAA
jgi:2-octaprenyl-6-methoxyphenol hydroxylase